MPTPAHLREAEEPSAAFQLALAQIGVETVAEALEPWESANPARLAATAARWLDQAIQLILTRRRQSRDLAMADYRLVRALPTGATRAEAASAAAQLALAQTGVGTVAEALALWASVTPARPAPTAERCLNQAIQLLLTRRRQSRDLAMAYYRLVRPLRTGSTVADPTLPSPRYVTLEVLRNEFRELVGDAESDLPDGPLPEGDGSDLDEER